MEIGTIIGLWDYDYCIYDGTCTSTVSSWKRSAYWDRCVRWWVCRSFVTIGWDVGAASGSILFEEAYTCWVQLWYIWQRADGYHWSTWGVETQMWRCCIPLQLITDHTNLEYFIIKKLFNHRQAWWSEFWTLFDYDIVYRPGKCNTSADVRMRRQGDCPEVGGWKIKSYEIGSFKDPEPTSTVGFVGWWSACTGQFLPVWSLYPSIQDWPGTREIIECYTNRRQP